MKWKHERYNVAVNPDSPVPDFNFPLTRKVETMNKKIKLKWQAGIVAAAFFAGLANAGQELATTPPMGWNSYDSYGVYLHEKAAFANLEAMAAKLKPHGYEYFVIDNGWFGEYTLQPGTIFPAEKHAHDVKLNEYDPRRFLICPDYQSGHDRL